LTWALYWLAKRADIAERVTAEIDGHIVNDNPCSDDLKALEYTTRFVNEVLRLSTRRPGPSRATPLLRT
jgi:cytochrome P450